MDLQVVVAERISAEWRHFSIGLVSRRFAARGKIRLRLRDQEKLFAGRSRRVVVVAARPRLFIVVAG